MKFDDEPVSERVGPELEAEFLRLGPQESGDKSRPRSREGDLECCAEAEKASAINSALCEGDPGAPGLATTPLPLPDTGDNAAGWVLSLLNIGSAPVTVLEVADRPVRLDSPV